MKSLKARPQTGQKAKVYPSAVVQPDARLGADVVVGAFTFVADGAVVGPGTRIQGHTSIWSGVELGEDVFVGPAATFTNVRRPRAAWSRAPNWDETRVGDGASIGAGAILVAPVAIGRFAMVGAGAVVTKDVPDHAVVAGNPARVIGWTCRCGSLRSTAKKRPAKLSCEICGDARLTAERAARPRR